MFSSTVLGRIQELESQLADERAAREKAEARVSELEAELSNLKLEAESLKADKKSSSSSSSSHHSSSGSSHHSSSTSSKPAPTKSAPPKRTVQFDTCFNDCQPQLLLPAVTLNVRPYMITQASLEISISKQGISLLFWMTL